MSRHMKITEFHGRWRMSDYQSQWIERDDIDDEAKNAPMLAALLPDAASALGDRGDAVGLRGKFRITVEFTEDEEQKP
jgi:hypothetical protein